MKSQSFQLSSEMHQVVTVGLKKSAELHGSQRMNPNYSCHPMTFFFNVKVGFTFVVSRGISDMKTGLK